MKTAELTGSDLDYFVARAQGAKVKMSESNERGLCLVHEIDEEHGDGAGWFPFSPSTAWADGGKIIERERIIVWPTTLYIETDDLHQPDELRQWAALHPNSRGLGGWTDGGGGVDVTSRDGMPGLTPMIAAMRAYVHSVFGEDVDATA